MSKKNSKKLMFFVSVFMITILAGCSHIPQPSETKKDDISKTQLEMTKDEDGDIDDMSQEIDDDADLGDEMSEEDDDMDDGEGVKDMDDDMDDDDLLNTSSEAELTAEEAERSEKAAKEFFEKMNDSEVGEKTIVMTSFVEIIDGKYFPQFSEKEVTVKKGDKVKFKITNTKGTHDFKIDEFDVFTETPEGEEVEVEFVADKVGEFVYYCTKTGHRQNGHWGTLKVVE